MSNWVSLSQFFLLAQFFSSLALNSISKLSYVIMCRCLSRDLQVVGHLVMTPPPTIAQAEEMILWLLLVQGGQQEKPLGEVTQVPPKLMRKLQMWPRAGLSEMREKQELVDRRHPHRPTDFSRGENQSMINRHENPYEWTTELHDHWFWNNFQADWYLTVIKDRKNPITQQLFVDWSYM
jgi:hypothetical protein